MRCLVISPVPTVPAVQGNAVNTARLGRALQEHGFHVHFVYSAMEGMAPETIEAMSAQWDTLDVIPHPGIRERPARHGYTLDAWFDPAVGDHVERLCRRWRFDLALVHYVWMSAVFERMPADLPKLLYTHDRFADRHAMLARAGIAPTWYSISPADEARGLARADIVVAVQPEEAERFRAATSAEVRVVGSLQPLRRRPPRLPAASEEASVALAAGWIASSNPSNRRSLLDFVAAVDRCPDLTAGAFRLVVAGPICEVIDAEAARPWIHPLGIVDHPDRVYERVDLIVNPSVGGSGLKIKSVEALADGMPLVGTTDAMIGLPASHPAQTCAGPREVAAQLTRLFDASVRADLAEASHRLIETYRREQTAAFTALLDDAARLAAKRGAAA